MQTYLFYDIETTGLNKAFDQILHFAAIRTDSNLKELERYELKIKLNPDTVPSPGAMLTHRMHLAELAHGITEFDAIKKIHRWMNEPGTISLGYNTLGFDDEFLRFSFYRNLLPPYTHQYANACGRMDLYPIAVMYFLFKNKILTWPEIAGKTSFKLENLNATNQFVSGRAHHAMVDVEIALALAMHFSKEQEMWEYLVKFFNKRTDQERLHTLSNQEGLMIDGIFGSENYFQCPVLFLGTHRHYSNQTLWLRLDSTELNKIIPDTIPEMKYILRKKLGESRFILPLKERFLQHLSSERLTLSEQNKKWLQQHPEILQKITAYHIEYKYPVFPATDIDASLYLNGFWNNEEESFCRAFHNANPKEKARLTEQIKNPKLKLLATRILGRHYFEALTASQAEQFTEYTQYINPSNENDALIDYQGKKRLSPKAALNEIAAVRQQPVLDPQQTALLDELEAYLREHFSVSL